MQKPDHKHTLLETFFLWKDRLLASSQWSGGRRPCCNLIAGTLETKPFSITKEKYNGLFLNSVIPVVRDKIQRRRSQIIIAYQDNASLHNISDIDEVLAFCNDAPTFKIV